MAAVAIAGMTLATPVLWSHALLLTLPLQAGALAIADRRRRITPSEASLRRYELPLVTLAALALQFSDGIGGGLETSRVALQLAATAVPVVAPVALAIYFWRYDSPDVRPSPLVRELSS